jgi:hypothetical protein
VPMARFAAIETFTTRPLNQCDIDGKRNDNQ